MNSLSTTVNLSLRNNANNHKAIKKVRSGQKVYNPTTDQQRRELLHQVIDCHMTIHEVKHRVLTPK